MAREGTGDPKLMLYERGISSDVFTVILQGKALICDLTNGKSALLPSACLLRVASVIDAAIHARGSETFPDGAITSASAWCCPKFSCEAAQLGLLYAGCLLMAMHHSFGMYCR